MMNLRTLPLRVVERNKLQYSLRYLRTSTSEDRDCKTPQETKGCGIQYSTK